MKIIFKVKMSKKLLKADKLESILGIKINDPLIWLSAVIHKSWIFYHKKTDVPNNERLEFLGDSVLQLIASHYLYETFPHLSEGDLSLLRARLVNRQRLGQIALSLKLDEIINIAPNLDSKGKLTVLGDSLEAIIGALYLDQGFETAKKFVLENILKNSESLLENGSFKDPKTLLQEICQKKYGVLPVYETISISGPPHRRKFKVKLSFKDKTYEGQGSSKQEAEFNAAQKALKELDEGN